MKTTAPMPPLKRCHTCKTSGQRPGYEDESCRECSGAGYHLREDCADHLNELLSEPYIYHADLLEEES